MLVTGGAGFIGSHLAEALTKRGNHVSVLDDLSTGSRDNIEHLQGDPKFSFVLGTILDASTVDSLVSQCQMVYHLAAAVGVKYIIDNPLNSLRINIKGTENVFESANRHKRKVILASTSEIYGKNEKDRLSEDDDRILGSTAISRWGYSCTKAFDEFLALAYWREKKLPVVALRYFNTCGPRQTGEYGMVIPRFVKAALLGHPLLVYGDGKQIRCFSYIDDIVEGTIALAEHPKAEGEIFNLGSTEPITISELAHKIVRMTNSNSKIEYVPYEQAYEKGFEDLHRRVPDISKARKLVGFEPKTSLEQLLRKVIEYFSR
ncbi:MAG: NAD-dependent epimerase/dehydratase family protein [Candidatus Abyssobacteria bacterium SURF_5]|uniref:NAD-dependent epimerase/dehydratase family protein n=1 Tax=Abyssobacteria bacterium (strain SURF_5) TaxID=2093360 RepID=A0A3A4NEK6_ABYX5|nr:MAG: NAD-dependent epimerase/dehydratase family protein [Candidatus Abyssubacteria bacterium SURF_5]